MRSQQQHLLDTASDILTSQTLRDTWARHHKSKADQSPAIDIIKQIKDISQNIENHPEMLLFMREMIGIEINALGRFYDDNKDLKQYLDNLYVHTNKLCEDHNLSLKNTEMPAEYQSMLDMLEYQTGKTPVRPLKSLWNATKAGAKHVAKDAKENPYVFGSLLSLAVGMVYVSKLNADKFATTFLDESARDISDLGEDFWSNDLYDFADDDGDTNLTDDGFSFDPELASTIQIDPSCHAELTEMAKLFAGDLGETIVSNIPSFITDELPQHCTRVKSLAHDTINGLNGAFGIVHERMDLAIKDPANNIGEMILQNTPFQTAFLDAVHNTSEFWYGFNDIENIAVHVTLTVVTAGMVRKRDSLSTEESKEWNDAVSDFFHRTTRNLPLSYGLACGGSVYAYAANNGLTADMLLYGAGGIIAGNTIHKLHRISKSSDIVGNTLLCVNKKIAEISDATKILYDKATCNNHSYKYEGLGWGYDFKTPTIAISAVTALTALDINITGGQTSGTMLGGALVTTQYLIYNVFEDIPLHGLFIALGIGIGKSITYAEKTCTKIKRAFDNNFDNDNDDIS